MRCINMWTLARYAALAPLVLFSITAYTQSNYPTRPVRIIVPSAAGGGLDTMARLISQKLTDKFGQSFVVENRTGAGGSIGISAGAKASSDGYTLIIISGTHAGTSHIQGKGQYDLKRDFVPVIWATTQPYIMNVNPQVPARNVKELIDLAKAKPGELNYGSPGAGSAQHLAGVLLGELAGARLFHIPYKGGSLVVNDIIAGRIQVSFTNYLVCRAHIEAGRLQALAVTTLKRSAALPDLPAISETVRGYDADNWYGLIAPAKSPAAILDLLHREIGNALNAPQVKQRLAAEASEVVLVSRAEFGKHVAQEVDKWGAIIRRVGIDAK